MRSAATPTEAPAIRRVIQPATSATATPDFRYMRRAPPVPTADLERHSGPSRGAPDRLGREFSPPPRVIGAPVATESSGGQSNSWSALAVRAPIPEGASQNDGWQGAAARRDGAVRDVRYRLSDEEVHDVREQRWQIRRGCAVSRCVRWGSGRARFRRVRWRLGSTVRIDRDRVERRGCVD